MILKYKVPPQYYTMFNNKNVIYCKVLNKTEALNQKVYLVRMLNHNNLTNVFAENELKKLNLLDRIRLLFINKEEKENEC